MIIGSLPWAPWLRKKLEAWAEGDVRRQITAAPQKGNEAAPPCQVKPTSYATPAQAHVVAAVNVTVDIALLAILVLSSMSIVSSGYNPFIYFQF